MKPKYLLPLTDHPELTDQDKAKYKNVVPWRYEQSHGRFLDRDRVSFKEVDILEAVKSGSGLAGLFVGGCAALFVLLVFTILFWI